MAGSLAHVNETQWRSLKRISDAHLKASDQEEDGSVYDEVFADLQIRYEEHEAFFECNVRPFRNKKDNSILLAKGDDASLLKLSEAYLRAYGNLVWGKERKWLVDPEDLDDDDSVLRYVPPRERKEGDHDRFHKILAKLWKQMRGIIFEIKTTSRQRRSSIDSTIDSTTITVSGRSTPQPPIGTSLSTMSTRQGARHVQKTPEQAAHTRQVTTHTHDIEPRRPYFYEPPIRNEISIPGYWSASKTEQVILDAITDLKFAQQASHPQVFTTLFQRHIARLEEVEQFEKQQLDMLTEVQDSTRPGQQDNFSTVQTEIMTHADNADPDTIHVRTVTAAEQPNEADQTTRRIATSPSLPPPTAHSNKHRPPLPPSFPLTAYIPPTLPATMTTYITPFSHPATHPAQPYIWPDTPVHATSFATFRTGIRVRANVPKSVPEGKIAFVLGYGWNDFCCVVRGEQSWTDRFMRDLRRASEKGGVVVWRMRVCVVVVGGG